MYFIVSKDEMFVSMLFCLFSQKLRTNNNNMLLTACLHPKNPQIHKVYSFAPFSI